MSCGFAEAEGAGFISLEKRSLESEGKTSLQSSFTLGNAGKMEPDSWEISILIDF